MTAPTIARVSRLRDAIGLADVVDLVLPRRCLGCRRPGPSLCGSCARAGLIRRTVAGVGPVWAAGGYQGALRAALLRYKERDRRDLAPVLARLLATAVLAALPVADPDRVAVVPSRRSAVRARGGDHLGRLVRVAGLARIRAPDLCIVRPIADAAGLDPLARRRNLAGAFAATAPTPGLGRRILLVDDIVTSGATLAEAARALAAAGWTVTGAATIASTPLPTRSPV